MYLFCVAVIFDAFNAVYFNSATTGVINFDPVKLPNSSYFNGVRLSVPLTSLYWTYLSTDVPPNTPAKVGLVGTENNVKINKTHQKFSSTDTMGRSGVIQIQPGEELMARADYPCSSLSWSAFRLDSYFDPLVVFSVARLSPVTSQGLITFDIISSNYGQGWSASTNSFTAPKAGQYFFSLSSALSPAILYVIKFIVDNNEIQSFQFGAANLLLSGDLDLNSVSCFTTLGANQKITASVTVTNGATFLFADSKDYQLSLSGMLYSPPITNKV